jgi:hypothetical protein
MLMAGDTVTGVPKAAECRLAYRSRDGSLSDKPWSGWRSGQVGARVEIVVEKRPEVIQCR